MFEMDREMLERLVGREEGARLDSQLTVQRNLAGVSIVIFTFI